MSRARSLSGMLAVVALAVALSACGSSGSGSSTVSGSSSGAALSSSGYASPLNEPLTGGKRGGVLTVLNETDFEHIDPGMMYYAIDYEVGYATQSPLYMDKPNTVTEASPVLAEGPPQISSDSETVTVHIKKGFHFSPPVNREVTSEDVKYAFERAANPNVANPYLHAYFNPVEGVPTADGGPIKGIVTPNKYTIVFKLDEPKAAITEAMKEYPAGLQIPAANVPFALRAGTTMANR